MIKFALIGSTASGKSDLAIDLAKKIDAYILSIDSLSIYKEVDIVSAKPSKDELKIIKHFGIDEYFIDEYFSVEVFINLYKNVVARCKEDGKNLIIVGGTSFYLKSLLSGLSPLPTITQKVVDEYKNIGYKRAYELLFLKDAAYMSAISSSDKYRIEKAMLIYLASGLSPSEYFRLNPPKPIVDELDIFNIEVTRDELKNRIEKRTKKMFESGLLDEVSFLEQKYTRKPNAMNSIGIVEALEYLDSKVSLDEMIQNISTHTLQLAKRQQTFNKTQFEGVINKPLEKMSDTILEKMVRLR
ncbi:MAG: tRNA (adenosine(37)-N6)-dimethylallyltransferase MiaA [Sulfurimonas sp.]|jgi:tRNA dimethylallyltransferase|nr:tRNA (adenosine(37)-N6)-dimethylallyltransferase MiaA [Sulfurimonadaceae bacterium]